MHDLKFLKILTACSFALLAGASVWVLFYRQAPVPVALESYGQAPAFKLTSQLAQPFDSASLAGKVWVASFIYTSCKESCPMLGAQMKRLSKSMPDSDGFRLISISVDPEKDSPEKLAQYARDLGADDPRWSFLTGAKAAITNIVVHGFKLADLPSAKDGADMLHSSKLVLVDKQGMIRGYFDGTLGESAESIKRAATQLLAQP